MNQNRFQANKENNQTLLNGKNQRILQRPLIIKELSQNTSLILEKKPSFGDNSEPKTMQFESNPTKIANPQEVAEYQSTIYEYLKRQGCIPVAQADYMSKQRDVSIKMRAILIDWLIDVHIKFKLLPQTIFMTVNLIDRYLSIQEITRQHLQLVGITSLMVICKYEEIYPPLIKDYISVCDNAYTKDQILEMESLMIKTLNFEMTVVSAYVFLEYLQLKIQMEPKEFVFARYILENSLFDLNCLRYGNLIIVTGAIFLVNKIFKRGSWKSGCEQATGISEVIVKQCAKDLFHTMQKAEALTLTALKRKFSTPEFFEVSKYRIEKAKN